MDYEPVNLPLNALDGLDSGIVKVDRNGAITYANAKFLEIVGITSWKGLNIRDLLTDEQSYQSGRAHLENRINNLVADKYRLSLRTLKNDAPVQIEILGFPEVDDHGKGIGSISLVRDVTAETAYQAIHSILESSQNWTEKFRRVATVIREVIPFNWFTVSLYSEDGRHVRQLFQIGDEEPDWNFRWFEIPEIAALMMAQKKALVIADIAAYLGQPGWEDVLKDDVTQQFLQLGFQSSLWYPVIQDNRLVAAFGMYHREADKFSMRQKTMLDDLPLRRVIAMSLNHLQREDLEFRLGLIKELAGCSDDDNSATIPDIEQVSELLVRRVRKQYQWNSVSLFRVDIRRNKFILIRQSPESGPDALQPDYVQGLDEGILSHVYKHRASIRTGDVRNDPNLSGLFKPVLESQTLSELAIPILVDGNVCAVLNIEDQRKNAFSVEEQHALELVVKEVSGIFKRINLEQILNAIIHTASDAIFRTDNDGTILWHNQSAAVLLKYEPGQLDGCSLADLFAESSLADVFFQADSIPNEQITLVRGDGKKRSFLISGATLPEHIGGRVYVAADLTMRKHREKLDYLRGLFHEIAEQTQVPLSLCFSWLRRLSRQVDEPAKATVRKIQQQLAKAQITFDRLSLYEREGSSIPNNPVLLYPNQLLGLILDELPEDEVTRIRLTIPDNFSPVRADFYRLSFSLFSVLVYLVRYLPVEGEIQVILTQSTDDLHISFWGTAPMASGTALGEFADEQWSTHTLLQLSLGKDMIHRFINDMGGEFNGPTSENGRTRFDFRLPLALSSTVS